MLAIFHKIGVYPNKTEADNPEIQGVYEDCDDCDDYDDTTELEESDDCPYCNLCDDCGAYHAPTLIGHALNLYEIYRKRIWWLFVGLCVGFTPYMFILGDLERGYDSTGSEAAFVFIPLLIYLIKKCAGGAVAQSDE
ncbi:hypothetical protein AGMMS49975_22180 [Clostridia bacterium]|nr:hypothetical protein AGMMS49975_22180 [Clostridia bacterium]